MDAMFEWRRLILLLQISWATLVLSFLLFSAIRPTFSHVPEITKATNSASLELMESSGEVEQQGQSSHRSFSASVFDFFRAMTGRKSQECKGKIVALALIGSFSRAFPAFPTGTGACRVRRQTHLEHLSVSLYESFPSRRDPWWLISQQAGNSFSKARRNLVHGNCLPWIHLLCLGQNLAPHIAFSSPVFSFSFILKISRSIFHRTPYINCEKQLLFRYQGHIFHG